MKNLIYVALSSFSKESEAPLKRLKESGYPYLIHTSGKRITSEELIAGANNAEVILAGVESYDADVLGELSNLKCISRCGVGLDSINIEVAKSRGVTVLNTPGIPTLAVAELALTMFLALSRNLPAQMILMRSGKWVRVPSHLLSGKSIGLIGFGSIGRRVANLSKSFNAKIYINDPLISDQEARDLGVELVTKDFLLNNSDIISLHASQAGVKDGPIIGEREIRLMKPGAILVNLARGGMVDELALFDALSEGRLGGAGLDVFTDEPYTGKLAQLNTVILTPHSATNTIETRVEMELMCVENAIKFIENRII